MTVGQLIEELKKLDQNKKIMISKTYQDERDECQTYTENETPDISTDYDENGQEVYILD